MITFASLFLGLTFGVQSVEMVVTSSVASIELRLDGEAVGTLREAPWQMPVDFGSELAPRHLEAVALDAQGAELGRVSQWLNLPQPSAVANVVLEPRTPGQPRVARINWESAAGAEPESVSVSLDGQSVPVSDPRRIVLPLVNESQLHLLHVDLRFEGRVATRLDVTFAGPTSTKSRPRSRPYRWWLRRRQRRPASPRRRLVLKGWRAPGGPGD